MCFQPSPAVAAPNRGGMPWSKAGSALTEVIIFAFLNVASQKENIGNLCLVQGLREHPSTAETGIL